MDKLVLARAYFFVFMPPPSSSELLATEFKNEQTNSYDSVC